MLVSIITPTYNRCDPFRRAARSVLQQTYNPIEYIVVDDGSAVDTEAVIADLPFGHLQYIEHPQQRGVSVARNTGLKAATGEFALFLDSDDTLPLEAIETLVTRMRSAPDSCGGVFGRVAYYREGATTRIRDHYPDKIGYQDFRRKNYAGAFGGKLFRTAVFDDVGYIDPTFPSSEDFDFFLRMTQEGYHFECVNAITYHRFLHKGQISANSRDQVVGYDRVLEKHGDQLTARHAAERLYKTAHICATRGEMDEARARLRRCISVYPPSRPVYFAYLAAISIGAYDYLSRMHAGVHSVIRHPWI